MYTNYVESLNKEGKNKQLFEICNAELGVKHKAYKEITYISKPYKNELTNILKAEQTIYKHCYSKGDGIFDFFNKIVAIVGGEEVFTAFINRASTKPLLETNYNINEVQSALLTYFIYETYIGFVFEDLVAEELTANGWSVETNDSWDVDYAIDLVATKDEQTVGVQCKCESFKKLTFEQRQYYYAKNNVGVKNSVCDFVIYLLHNECGELVSERILPFGLKVFNSTIIDEFEWHLNNV